MGNEIHPDQIPESIQIMIDEDEHLITEKWMKVTLIQTIDLIFLGLEIDRNKHHTITIPAPAKTNPVTADTCVDKP